MSSNHLSSILDRPSSADDQPFEKSLDEGQEGDGLKQTRAGSGLLRVLLGDDFTDPDGSTALATTRPEALAALRVELQNKYGFDNILSKSPLMHAVFHLIKDLAHAKATVLIEGETGTGKEEVARAIHGAATRRRGAFVAVNCAGLPETLLESELFGHEKGAFTGAAGQRRGRFEMAQGGSIFLDEVGDMPASMQAKLLRVLQERSFERIGGTETIKVDVRVLSATNRSLRDLAMEGKFRADLYYRLNVVKIVLPPLCHRPEDIPLLAAHFIRKHTRPSEAVKQITAQALGVLLHYSWPGNIRELANAIERACVTSRGFVIDVKDLPPELIADVKDLSPRQAAMAMPLCPFSIDLRKSLAELIRDAITQIESQYLRKVLVKTHGHVGKCAVICGMSRRAISSKIAKYKLDRLQFIEV